MRLSVRSAMLSGCAILALTAAVRLAGQSSDVSEATATFAYTKNMHPLGYSARVVPTDNTVPGSGVFNTDLAFWGNTAVQGTFAGFRLVDVSDPQHPVEVINWTECAGPTNTEGNQGDVSIWGNLVVRSWNSPAPAAGSRCGTWTMAPGEEGVHVIDISDPHQPTVVAFVDTLCGSHTSTIVPDLENDRLLVYSNSAANAIFADPPATCRGFDIIEVPLANPGAASHLRFVPGGAPSAPFTELNTCHDGAVILGTANLVACVGASGAGSQGNGVNVYSIDPADGGAKDNPVWLYHKTTGGISLGHSASFTWDGEILVVGHEPGGGASANCEATDNPLERTFFFVEARTGISAGQFALPRTQTDTENCTTHYYNIVPTDKRYLMVSGNYQSGVSVVDFTDPANAVEIAYADPAPLTDPNSAQGVELGGDWSSYWYNGLIYESDITRGMIIWRLSDQAISGAKKLSHLNPQTQSETFPFKGSAGK